MTEQYTNYARSALESSISGNATSLTVLDPSSFPTTGNFRIVVDNEILLVTAVAYSTFTVQRGYENTPAVAHYAGAIVAHVLTAGGLTAIITQVANPPLVLTAQTTNATPTELQINGTTRALIPANATWIYSAWISARRNDAGNESAAYEIRGCIDNNSGVVALVGSALITIIARDDPAWAVSVSADTGALSIRVAGESGKTINWVGTLSFGQVLRV
jgi:hypothetical protein